MNNKEIAKVFKLYAQLMELHGENPFRTKAISSSVFKVEKIGVPILESTVKELSDLPGIGKSTAEKIHQIAHEGTFSELDELLAKTPKGILDLLEVKGLGPKKVLTIWKEMNITDLGELLYACNENRLAQVKGFGVKTQAAVQDSIEFILKNKGWYLYAKIKAQAEHMLQLAQSAAETSDIISFTGEFRRSSEILQRIEILHTLPLIKLKLALSEYNQDQVDSRTLRVGNHPDIPVDFIHTTRENFARDLMLTTGSDSHVQKLTSPLPSLPSEQEIYQSLGLSFIPPELREGTHEVEKAKNNQIPNLITVSDLKGSLHNHSTYSDGKDTLKDMALYCRDNLKLEYFGIADHSPAAHYAGGLSIEKVQQQWEEIDLLNKELAPFKIFKGTESDILEDGSLDYPSEILAGFDYVVASIHRTLGMDEERATERLIKAIENPYTTILGHPTGRLLLSRPGYPIDFKKVIDACKANGVTIEINANPLRLDLDWRHHQYAIEQGVLLSINPDAHIKEGLLDMEYGVQVARKGGLEANGCLNAKTLDEITQYFKNKK